MKTEFHRRGTIALLVYTGCRADSSAPGHKHTAVPAGPGLEWRFRPCLGTTKMIPIHSLSAHHHGRQLWRSSVGGTWDHGGLPAGLESSIRCWA